MTKLKPLILVRLTECATCEDDMNIPMLLIKKTSTKRAARASQQRANQGSEETGDD